MRFLRRLRISEWLSPGSAKAVVFLLLIAITLAFWLYIQKIFDHVRDFQKSVVQTHVQIYMKLIDPNAQGDSDLLELYEPVVMNAPYPSIFTYEDLTPIQDLWHDVGVAQNDTTSASREKLIRLVRKMDKSNPPVPVFMPDLVQRTDTLTVYEMPPEPRIPILITDHTSNYLYSRFLSINPEDPASMQAAIEGLDELSSPIVFEKDNEPTLRFHTAFGDSRWPIIVVKNGREPIYWGGFRIASSDTTATLKRIMRDISRTGYVYTIISSAVPVKTLRLFHYGDLPFLTLIGWLPLIELGVILILLAIAMIGLVTIKNAEQRSIWVGMAKETAHQLGTPISSLSGWYELLKSERDLDMLAQALPEMEYDVRRLSRVAARFSNIGSQPELKQISLSNVIYEVLDYYRARLPRMGKNVSIEGDCNGIRDIMGNTELLNWAFENMIKNSLSAIESRTGTIRVTGRMSKNFESVIIDFSDTGKGIAQADQNKVMKPGFTTKKRGWGLGLSLVKRIVEDYHNGKIILLESKPGTGATFRVIIPAVSAK